ncbi:MAG: ATP-binding protein [Corallococcus sp.]|nr:ATP-binding protein [Bacillota bacterium]MCM1533178.1 ATP-binding protein [Corallococcus sp.]
MTTYIVVYSIIMALLAGVCVALCVICFSANKSKARKDLVRVKELGDGEKAFADIYGKGKSSAFLVVDAQTYQPVYISSGVYEFFGVTKEELFLDTEAVKKHIDREYTRAFENNFKQWDKTDSFEQEFGYGDGKFGKIEAFCAESDGKDYIAFTILDITEQKNSRDEMKKQLDFALEQAAAKSSFLSNMSHEIRTPMNGVMGMISLARMNVSDPEKVSNYLERAGDLSVFLLSMINDILDISKIESGKMQLFNAQMDIMGFAEKIRNMFNTTVTSKGINFLVETVDISARYLVADEMRLTQVVTNLVSNANKFTPAGGKIEVTFKQLDNIGGNIQLMIRVRDTGKGIAPENIHKIMRPFEQEEASTSHHYGGTGLGLAICDNIVRLMGGNIVVDSELGKGTDFSVFLSLPVAEVEQDAETAAVVAEEVYAEASDFTFKDCRILLAEDNEVNAEIAIEILESEGAVVTWAHDGQEAVDTFTESKEYSFDLVLLDIQMPRLNGRDAARAIRNSGKADAESAPIIALSADAFVEDIKLSEAAGMDGHVSKPIDFNELRKRSGEIIAAKKSKKVRK